ncbi:MAG: YciI family protein [Cyanobacteria bacterium P01_G01_bin.54]
MPWFVKIESGIVDKAIFDQHVPAHCAYVRSLIEQGHPAQTGYWAERGGGMLVFEASSLAEAQQIVENDPLIQNNCVTYELHEWCVVVPKTQ